MLYLFKLQLGIVIPSLLSLVHYFVDNLSACFNYAGLKTLVKIFESDDYTPRPFTTKIRGHLVIKPKQNIGLFFEFWWKSHVWRSK